MTGATNGVAGSTGRWRPVLLFAAAVGFVETLLFAVLGPLLPTFERDLGLSKVGAGLLTSGYALGAFVAALPSIWLARRIGVKRTALLGLLVLAASSVAFSFPDTSAVVFTARFGQGVGSAFAYTGALAWLTAVAPSARRAEAIGMVFAVAFTGALVGPMLGAVAEEAGAAPVFSAVAGVSLLLAVVAAALPAPPAAEVPTGPLRSLASEPTVRIGVWLVGLVGLLFGVLSVLGPLRLDELGWGAVAIGITFALGGVTQAVVNPIAGRMADVHGRTLPLRIGLVASATVSFLLVLDDNDWLYATLAVCAATAFGTLWTPATAVLVDTVEQRGLDQAAGFGLMSAAWPPGFALGAAAGGALAAVATDALPYALGALACVLTLPLLHRLR